MNTYNNFKTLEIHARMSNFFIGSGLPEKP